MSQTAVAVENGFDLVIGSSLQHGFGQSDDDIAQPGPPGTRQPVTFRRRAGEEPIHQQHGRPLLGQQLALQRLDFRSGATPDRSSACCQEVSSARSARSRSASWLNKRWFLLSALAADSMRIESAAPGSSNRSRCATGVAITPTRW